MQVFTSNPWIHKCKRFASALKSIQFSIYDGDRIVPVSEERFTRWRGFK
jgi:hypothetical protein